MIARVQDIVKIMETFYPLHLAEEWDNVGLQIGSYQDSAEKVLVVLDIDEEVLAYSRMHKVNMIISHHPLLFNGVKTVNYDQVQGSMIKNIITAGISVYAAHTNLDAGAQGLNQMLAELIGLQDIKPLDKGKTETLFKLVVYVPADHEEKVRQAIFAAGAGHIGKYKDCSFRVQGTGSFRPLTGSTPYIGQAGKLEELPEYRMETVVAQAQINQVLQNMRKAHPYEEVAYDLFRLAQSGQSFSLGRKGLLPGTMLLHELCELVKNRLELDSLRVTGDMHKPMRKMAVVSGAGANYIGKAHHSGCDVLLTGDLKYHEAKNALDMGLAVIDAGHQGTEQIISTFLPDLISAELPKKGLTAEVMGLKNKPCILSI